MKKISFLIAAHNEEKIIAETLENLLKVPYKNYEVIIGLDGCTDNTEEIVKKYSKKFKKIKYFKLNLRRGKPEVIDNIIKRATGEIIIINDADWKFKVGSKKLMDKFISVFDNPQVGGIVESFPVEWERSKLNKGNIGYLMVAYSSYFWINFQKENLTIKKGDHWVIKDPFMFLTNIFRKKLYQKNFSLGDDFERTKNILEKGYDLVIFKDINMPRRIAVYNKIRVLDIFKQKIRTAIARKQLNEISQTKLPFLNYYIKLGKYMLFKSWKEGFNVGFLILLWMFLTGLGELISKFKKGDTKKGWELRMKR
ncbi:glycosyltransferase [Nanoarchaeota archaeon]